MDRKYQTLLQHDFPTKAAVATEIINLSAILNLPKATEHFMSDLHGEYDAFQHVLRNGSGNVRKKIEVLFGDQYTKEQIKALATLIYYPEAVLANIQQTLPDAKAYQAWYEQNLIDIITVCAFSAQKYTRSKVRKALPADFAYIIEELLYTSAEDEDKKNYYKKIVDVVLELHQETALIVDLCYLIQHFVVDHLHIVGDIYDRGPYPDKIMDTLMNYHSVDIQWGNHDILWLAAGSGVAVCLANVIRISARYNNLDILEDNYGINLRPLINFAEATYQFSPIFAPKETKEQTEKEQAQVTQIHQAIAVLQFKLEGQIIARRPTFKLADRDMLSQINYQKQTITLDGVTYPLTDHQFPTVNPENPNQLTAAEEAVLAHLQKSFLTSEKLQRHLNFLFERGQMYERYNDNLLLHGCLPMADDHNFETFEIDGQAYAGKKLLDYFDQYLRQLHANSLTNQKDGDLAWYLWTGECSPLFGKIRMTTFERYYVTDKKTHHEAKNPYYQLRGQEAVCRLILAEFGLDPDKGHIINGHTPIKEKDGENPIKAGGKMIVIDGGFSKAYHQQTGIAGYTLLYNSYGMELAVHQPFTSRADAINHGTDIVTTKRVIDHEVKRQTVRDTSIGIELLEQLTDLRELYQTYETAAN